MTQILDLVDRRRVGTATTGANDEFSTPKTLDRLEQMLTTTVGTPAGEAPSQTTVAREPDIFNFNDRGTGAVDNDVIRSLTLPPPVGESTPDPDPCQAANDVVADEAANGVVGSADRELVSQMDHSAAEAALKDSVREAQEQAETQLMALVDRIRQGEAERHEAELARVIDADQHRQAQAVAEARAAVEAEAGRVREEIESRHAEALRTVHDNVQIEVAAAVEAALRDQNRRHADEVARMRAELEAQHVESLQRFGDAVMESMQGLTTRMVLTA